MDELKLCKDCKHCQPAKYKIKKVGWPWNRRTVIESFEFAKCAAPRFADKVSGDGGVFCTIVREHYPQCGRDGKLWEAKHGN